MTERAYQDVVASGQNSYRHFVEFVMRESLAGVAAKPSSAMNLFAFYLLSTGDSYIRFHQSYIAPLLRRLRLRSRLRSILMRVLPAPVLVRLRRVNRVKGV
jgi:hypothetical protein